jgi:hypothetical protein
MENEIRNFSYYRIRLFSNDGHSILPPKRFIKFEEGTNLWMCKWKVADKLENIKVRARLIYILYGMDIIDYAGGTAHICESIRKPGLFEAVGREYKKEFKYNLFRMDSDVAYEVISSLDYAIDAFFGHVENFGDVYPGFLRSFENFKQMKMFLYGYSKNSDIMIFLKYF